MKRLKVDRLSCPDRSLEEELYKGGYHRVAGLDEAGRGALAGPVVAAAVILPPQASFPWMGQVKDSKLLRQEKRAALFSAMQDSDIEMGIGIIASEVIDTINILQATRQAMKEALKNIGEPPDFVLTDAVHLPGLRPPQRNIIKGDRTCLCISCASIVAKVTRDRIMKELHSLYPGYGFNGHKGYGTSEHLQSLQERGACAIHRLSYRPVRALSRLL